MNSTATKPRTALTPVTWENLDLTGREFYYEASKRYPGEYILFEYGRYCPNGIDRILQNCGLTLEQAQEAVERINAGDKEYAFGSPHTVRNRDYDRENRERAEYVRTHQSTRARR